MNKRGRFYGNSLRTDGSFKNLAAFADEVLVECPHCKKRAVVSADRQQYTVPYSSGSVARFRCNNCYQPLDEKLWYGPISIRPVNVKCGYCGTPLIRSRKIVDKRKSQIEVKCTGCERERNMTYIIL